MYEVSSEIYKETDFKSTKSENGRVISKFAFTYPPSVQKEDTVETDHDGDLVLRRKVKGSIEIEHSSSTVLDLVGLQVWRGALLLADFMFHIREDIKDKQVLELGSGVGLTGIAAAIYAKKVVCTDIDAGGILELIRANIKTNRKLIMSDIDVIELDFKKPFSEALKSVLAETDIVFAADVIYDDDLTAALVDVLSKILDQGFAKRKVIYMALEKRYVFTIADLDTVAPCYEHFKRLVADKHWKLENVTIDFPQYFEYERCKDLILLKISS